MLFARAYWLAWRWLARYYSPPSSRRKTKWLPVSNKVTVKQVNLLFGQLVIQLMWYQYLNNYSPQCRWKWWIFTEPRRGEVDIHHYSPTMRWIIAKCNIYNLCLQHATDREYWLVLVSSAVATSSTLIKSIILYHDTFDAWYVYNDGLKCPSVIKLHLLRDCCCFFFLEGGRERARNLLQEFYSRNQQTGLIALEREQMKRILEFDRV